MNRGSTPPLLPIAGAVAALLLVFWAIRSPGRDTGVRPAPAIVATTLDGKPFDLAQQQGKMVLVNFWATWCGPCRAEFPDMKALQKKYGPKGLTVLGIAQETNENAVRAMVKEEGLDYPIVMITQEIAQAFSDVRALPTTLLVDQKGQIVFAFEGFDPEDPPREKFGREIEKRL